MTIKKYIIFLATLKYNIIRFYSEYLLSNFLTFKKRDWWNQIKLNCGTPLYLGALPIKFFFRNDLDALKKMGVKAVLTVTEPFENHFFIAIAPNMWKKENISHLQISTPDFERINGENITKGVEFIHSNISKGIPVYVHCKAGRGRSALIVLCYLTKYQGMSAEKGMDFIKKQRNHVNFKDYSRVIAESQK